MYRIISINRDNEKILKEILFLEFKVITHMGQQFLELESDEDMNLFKSYKQWLKATNKK